MKNKSKRIQQHFDHDYPTLSEALRWKTSVYTQIRHLFKQDEPKQSSSVSIPDTGLESVPPVEAKVGLTGKYLPSVEASTNELYNHLKNIILDTATKILRRSRKKSRNGCFDDECKLAQRTRARAEIYHDLRRAENGLHRREREAWEN